MPRVLLAVVLVACAWIASQAVATRRRLAGRERAAAGLVRDSLAREAAFEARRRAHAGTDAGGGKVPEWVQRLQAARLTRPNDAPPAATADQAARARREADGTYARAILDANDGRLVRWPAREALRVWVQGDPGIAGWTPGHRSIVRGALRTWDEAGLPFGVVASDDSTDADVFVLWRRRFDAGDGDGATGRAGGRIGQADRVTDEHGWIVAASIELALEDVEGRPLDVYAVQDAARHEIGHALGLDHSPDAGDVMAAHAGKLARLSARDLATVRLLYALPPGPLPR